MPCHIYHPFPYPYFHHLTMRSLQKIFTPDPASKTIISVSVFLIGMFSFSYKRYYSNCYHQKTIREIDTNTFLLPSGFSVELRWTPQSVHNHNSDFWWTIHWCVVHILSCFWWITRQVKSDIVNYQITRTWIILEGIKLPHPSLLSS